MNTFESETVNILDGIDDFTDLLGFDVGCRDDSNIRLPMLEDNVLLPSMEHVPWCITDLSEPASDSSSDSGISSVSVKHEPSSPDGSATFPPSPVYFDSSPSISETHDDVFLTDVFTDAPRNSSDVASVQHELSSPLSPFMGSEAVVSPLTYQPPTTVTVLPGSNRCALPVAAVSPPAPDSDRTVLAVVENGCSARASSACLADARVSHVLQSKIKIQPKFGVTVCQPQPAVSLLADAKVHGTVQSDAGSPLIVSAEDFARLAAAHGVLKVHQAAAPAAASSVAATTAASAVLSCSTVAPLVNSRPVANGIITVAAGAKRPIPAMSHSSIGSNSGAGDDGDDSCKAWKKQQRMIKNRESASLSRKRRKEYMTGLEQMLQQCSAENDSLKQENSMLRRRVEELQAENDRLMSGAPLNKKATATCLMTLAFLVAFKLSSFSPGQSPPAILTPLHSVDTGRVDQFSQAARLSLGATAHVGRSLLSIDEDRAWPDSDSLSRDSAGVNSSSVGTKPTRAELMVVENPASPLCPSIPYNGTESQRLVNDLSGWALRSKIAAKKTKMAPRAGGSAAIGTLGNNRRRGMATLSSGSGPAIKSPRPTSLPSGYAMQIYGSRDSVDGKFLDAIRRRNDTFYVISFRMDHWLLPATAHNKTARPKMAILVPALPLNESARTSDTMTMLQIECEVMDTRFLRIDHSIIPLHAAWYPEHTSTSGKTPFSTSTSVNASASRPADRAAPP